MKKIRLDLDSLKVESFVTNEHRGEQGTVFGMNTICANTCNGVSDTCEGPQTGCDISSFGQCDWTNPLETTCGDPETFDCWPTDPPGCGGGGGGGSENPCAESCDRVDCEEE